MFRLKSTHSCMMRVAILFLAVNTIYGQENETTTMDISTTTTTTTTTPSGPRACEATQSCCGLGCITIFTWDAMIFLVSAIMIGYLWWKTPWFCCRDKENIENEVEQFME